MQQSGEEGPQLRIALVLATRELRGGAVPQVSWQREASGDGRGVVEAVDSLAHAVLGHLQSGQGRPRASARKGRS